MNSNEEETRTKRSVTWDEVRQHKDRGNRWLVIDNDVYDITQWQHKHPGGAKILGHYAGEDASVRFFRLERIFTRPQRSWGKVMILQASVILLTGGGLPPPRGVCSGGGLSAPRGCLLPEGGVCSGRVSALGGVCCRGTSAARGSAARGMSASRGVCSQGSGGDPPGTATAAGGTHPTGM